MHAQIIKKNLEIFFGLILFNLLMNIKDTVWGFGKLLTVIALVSDIYYFKIAVIRANLLAG